MGASKYIDLWYLVRYVDDLNEYVLRNSDLLKNSKLDQTYKAYEVFAPLAIDWDDKIETWNVYSHLWHHKCFLQVKMDPDSLYYMSQGKLILRAKLGSYLPSRAELLKRMKSTSEKWAKKKITYITGLNPVDQIASDWLMKLNNRYYFTNKEPLRDFKDHLIPFNAPGFKIEPQTLKLLRKRFHTDIDVHGNIVSVTNRFVLTPEENSLIKRIIDLTKINNTHEIYTTLSKYYTQDVIEAYLTYTSTFKDETMDDKTFVLTDSNLPFFNFQDDVLKMDNFLVFYQWLQWLVTKNKTRKLSDRSLWKLLQTSYTEQATKNAPKLNV